MTAGETTTYVLGQLALPPTSLIALALAGVAIARWRRRTGTAIAAARLLALRLLSTTVVARALVQTLESPALAPGAAAGAQAIVILAGGRVRGSAEWGAGTVNAATLRRLRYGARLARETGLPVLLSGGDPERTGTPEARLMQIAFERDFGLRPRWVDLISDEPQQREVSRQDRTSCVVPAQAGTQSQRRQIWPRPSPGRRQRSC